MKYSKILKIYKILMEIPGYENLSMDKQGELLQKIMEVIMTKYVIECQNCGELAFCEGVCPNDVITDTGYTHGSDSCWYCPECEHLAPTED